MLHGGHGNYAKMRTMRAFSMVGHCFWYTCKDIGMWTYCHRAIDLGIQAARNYMPIIRMCTSSLGFMHVPCQLLTC